MTMIDTSAIGERWLLPEGVEELLPAQASRVERLRRELLDLFARWGYELVIPPLIEYTDSLLIGLGKDLGLQTFMVTDQLSGRLLGVRPDITAQAARIDAHSLCRSGPTRLCYAGSVLHTRRRSPFASRSPIQLGAELYGDASAEADLEIVCLMLETLRRLGLRDITLDLGHVGIFRELMRELGLPDAVREELFEALQYKSVPAITALVDAAGLDPVEAGLLRQLAGLSGDAGVLARAHELFAQRAPAACTALDELSRLAQRICNRAPEVTVHFDLCELQGYHYHTGLVFAAYVRGQGEAIANGGRYDDIGHVFGRARPATGFSFDLKTLLGVLPPAPGEPPCGIFVPHEMADDAWSEVCRLRDAGERVLTGLPGQRTSACCDRKLQRDGGGWRIDSL